jgi:DNA-binding LacI/PurR family transcriptional regulator
LATIVDVAKAAGVSVASVSRVLNGSKPVSLDARERVMRAARKLDYSIDQRARGLRRQKSGTIGLVVADAKNPFFGEILHAIEEVAYKSKLDLFFANSDEDPERESVHLRAMHAQRIDGIILLPVGGDASVLPPFLGRDTPLVCLDRRLPGALFDLAIVDNAAAAGLAVQYLAENGHVEIAILTAHDSTVSHERIAGFRTAMRAHGIPVRKEFIARASDAQQRGGYLRAKMLLSSRSLPSALVVTNHPLTLGALSAIRECGLRIPEDISLIGFDDTPYTGLLDPPLTTIAQPTSELGRAAARLLLERIAGYDGPPRNLVFPPALRLRKSVGRPVNQASAQ